MNEKRIEPRIDTAFIVKCMILPDKKNTFYTVIRDLSQCGVKILSENFLPLGRNLHLDINLIKEKAEAKAQVVWYSKMQSSEKYCIGLKFLEVNSSSKRKLGDLINTIYKSCD